MWLETIEDGFINTDHILRIDFEVSETSAGEDVSLLAKAVTGQVFYILSTGALRFSPKKDSEGFNKAVKEDPWGVMTLINDRIFDTIVAGKGILTLEEMKRIEREDIRNLLQVEEKHESSNRIK